MSANVVSVHGARIAKSTTMSAPRTRAEMVAPVLMELIATPANVKLGKSMLKKLRIQ